MAKVQRTRIHFYSSFWHRYKNCTLIGRETFKQERAIPCDDTPQKVCHNNWQFKFPPLKSRYREASISKSWEVEPAEKNQFPISCCYYSALLVLCRQMKWPRRVSRKLQAAIIIEARKWNRWDGRSCQLCVRFLHASEALIAKKYFVAVITILWFRINYTTTTTTTTTTTILWSSCQSSWLQIQRSGFDSLR
jgi:hypothetical protein